MLQPLFCVRLLHLVDEGAQLLAAQHALHPGERQADAVVGDAVLRGGRGGL